MLRVTMTMLCKIIVCDAAVWNGISRVWRWHYASWQRKCFWNATGDHYHVSKVDLALKMFLKHHGWSLKCHLYAVFFLYHLFLHIQTIVCKPALLSKDVWLENFRVTDDCHGQHSRHHVNLGSRQRIFFQPEGPRRSIHGFHVCECEIKYTSFLDLCSVIPTWVNIWLQFDNSWLELEIIRTPPCSCEHTLQLHPFCSASPIHAHTAILRHVFPEKKNVWLNLVRT